MLMLTGMLAFSMAACGKEEESPAKDQAQFEMIQSELEMGAEGLTETLTSLTEAERETYKESQDTFTVAAVGGVGRRGG